MAASNQPGVRWTIAGVLLFMTIVVASFIHRVGEPRIMSLAETRANGLFLFDTPRDVGIFRSPITVVSLLPGVTSRTAGR